MRKVFAGIPFVLLAMVVLGIVVPDYYSPSEERMEANLTLVCAIESKHQLLQSSVDGSAVDHDRHCTSSVDPIQVTVGLDDLVKAQSTKFPEIVVILYPEVTGDHEKDWICVARPKSLFPESCHGDNTRTK